MFDGWIEPQYSSMGGAEPWLDKRWKAIFYDKWVFRDHEVREFENSYRTHIGSLRKTIADGTYAEFFSLLEWFMRHSLRPSALNRNIAWALETAKAAYRVVDDDTIMPISEPADAQIVEGALSDLSTLSLTAPRRHLRQAAENLSAGNWADSVRESIHAVEATARILAPGANELSAALRRLEETAKIHGALKSGFGSIYGWTSDEKGIRHPLLDDENARVDEIDAMFMLGACSSFVSYLIGRARSAKIAQFVD